MKIIYVANVRIPTEKAHGYQIVKMCESFADNGADVELVLPRRLNDITASIFEYYNIQKNFKVRYFPVIDLIKTKVPGMFFLETLSFFFTVCIYIIFCKKGIIYCRGEAVIPLQLIASLLKKPLVWESHIKPTNIHRYVRALSYACAAVTVTKYYANELEQLYPHIKGKVLVAHDGVDLREVDISITKTEVREQLKLPHNKKIVLYTGSALSWKGLDVLMKASVKLPSTHLTVFVGKIEGENNDKQIFAGHIPHALIPLWLKAADTLVLTGKNSSDVSRWYTSPLKMFEYMASRRPIVAIDVPSFREVLNECNSYIVKESVDDLCDALIKVTSNEDLQEKISLQAYGDVQEYTWQKRAKNILEFIDKKLNVVL